MVALRRVPAPIRVLHRCSASVAKQLFSGGLLSGDVPQGTTATQTPGPRPPLPSGFSRPSKAGWTPRPARRRGPPALTVILNPLSEAPLQRLVHGLQPGGDVLVPAWGLLRPHQLLQRGEHVPAGRASRAGLRAQRRRHSAPRTMSGRPRLPPRPERARPQAGARRQARPRARF